MAGLLIATANPYDPSLLPYIVTPALSAGLIGGWSLAVISSGAAMLGLLLPGVQGAGGLGGSEYVVDAVQWSLLALAVGLLAAWVRRVQTEPPDDDESYLEAARLLVQLRDLSRELSGGLDAVSLASSLLDDVRTQFGMTRGWVFGYRTGGAPIPLAFGPGIDPGLAADLVSGPLWSRAVTDQTTQHTTGPLSSDQSMGGGSYSPCGSAQRSWVCSRSSVGASPGHGPSWRRFKTSPTPRPCGSMPRCSSTK